MAEKAAASSPLPLLLPQNAIPTLNNASHLEWTPKRYLSEPQPPPMDDMKLQELEMAAARQMMDGKIVKKTRPRRTVDYNGGLGRWALVSICPTNFFALLTIPRASCANCGQILRMYRTCGRLLRISLMYESHCYVMLWTQLTIYAQLLPPIAYPDNSSTSLCTKFVHTSTNKIRCPVNVVTVSQ